MKTSGFLRAALLLGGSLLIVLAVVLRSSDNPSTKRHSADLAYLKSVNSVAVPKDPELLFILMTEFANSNLQERARNFLACV